MSIPKAARSLRAIATNLALLLVLGASAAGCSNDLERFCEEATVDVCAKCFACAANDDEASTMCGLLVVTDEPGCRTLLHQVCASDDVAFNVETGRACQERISKLECEQLSREGKPEVCGRLF